MPQHTKTALLLGAALLAGSLAGCTSRAATRPAAPAGEGGQLAPVTGTGASAP
ncbi:MAG: hypothetical protein JWN87_2741, partial [Frankiales bacterium]|nr:hypothetical protein [Frankiales bacterium]